MPVESVIVGRDEVLPAANSSRPSLPPSPPQPEPIDMLLQEIKEINQRFMEVKFDVMNIDSVLKVGFDEGVVIRCSYVPGGPASQQMIHKLLLELILPIKYPTISPTAAKRMPHGCGFQWLINEYLGANSVGCSTDFNNGSLCIVYVAPLSVFSIVPSLGSEWLQRKAGCVISTSLTGRYMVGISGSSKIKIPKSEPQDTGLHALFSFQLMHHLGLPTTSPLLSDPCFTKRVKIKILGACPCLICPSHICHIAGDIWKAQFYENAPAVEGA
ncbi:hypothetical protein OROMI_001148 [Orobanche minor]